MGKQLISQIKEVFLTKDYQYTKHGAEQRVKSLPPIVKVITTYKPEPKEWIDYKIRRGK